MMSTIPCPHSSWGQKSTGLKIEANDRCSASRTMISLEANSLWQYQCDTRSPSGNQWWKSISGQAGQV